MQKAAWSGRSCTDPVWDGSSLPPAPYPCHSCMPSMHLLFISSSHVECSATQPSTTRPWQSPSQCQPCLLPPLRSELHLWPTVISHVLWLHVTFETGRSIHSFMKFCLSFRLGWSPSIGQSSTWCSWSSLWYYFSSLPGSPRLLSFFRGHP